jgi:hypothetical protein
VLLDTGWSLVSGFYEYDHSDVDILATSIVDAIPSRHSYDVMVAAVMQSETESSTGEVKFFCKNAPTDDITVTLSIFNP